MAADLTEGRRTPAETATVLPMEEGAPIVCAISKFCRYLLSAFVRMTDAMLSQGRIVTKVEMPGTEPSCCKT